MDLDRAVADDVESNAPAPAQGTAPVESRRETLDQRDGAREAFLHMMSNWYTEFVRANPNAQPPPPPPIPQPVPDRERVGTSSRQKQKFTHMTGSRSFASVAEAELFEITHRKKDGSPVTSEVGEILEKLKEKKAEYEAIASTDSSVNLENIDNRIITKVLGLERYDRVRFQESGVTPTQYFGSGSQQYMPLGSQAQAEVQRLRDQMTQMQANTVEQIAEVQ
ncbi:DnaJ subfamily C member 10 [Gossypium arboreum]|uniref:DnaJ subfamily C member 10 n=1 Tax=Gossypium arboreum TaxID=29729 RepID=A0A0B0PI62_GOSAR|nr:DnaJ subfamily C member 10 [Gossypium arboreum]